MTSNMRSRAPRQTKFGLSSLIAVLSWALLPAAHAEMSEITRRAAIRHRLSAADDHGGPEADREAREGRRASTSRWLWSTFAGGNVMNDALLSENLQFASGGVGPLSRYGRRTRGNLDVKAVVGHRLDAAVSQYPQPERQDASRTSPTQDKIALPAVKVSIQAVTLQMAAEKAFGEGQQNKLDRADRLAVAPRRHDGAAVRQVRDHRAFQLAAVPVPGARSTRASTRCSTPTTSSAARRRSTSSGRRRKFRNENPKALRRVRRGAR